MLNLVWVARDRWFKIGVQLNIGVETLKDISIEYSNLGYPYHGRDSGMCFREMLSEWLNASPSWEELATALDHDSVGYSDMAKGIRQMFNIVEKPLVSG